MSATRTVTVEIPASKSVSHRLQICAALAQGESQLAHLLDCDDTQRTRDALAAMGASSSAAANSVTDVFIGESGSTARFMSAVIATRRGGAFRVHGEGRMHERPMAPLLDVLRLQGCEIQCEQLPGCAPFVVRPSGLCGGRVEIETSNSSQYLSGLLMAAPCALSPMQIVPIGERIASWSYVPITLDAMEKFGAKVQMFIDNEPVDWRPTTTQTTAPPPHRTAFHVANTGYQPAQVTAESDWSSASYFCAAGALVPLTVRMPNLSTNSLQGDRAIFQILNAMGAQCTCDTAANTVVCAPSPMGNALRGVDVDMSTCPDIVPTVVVCALFANSPTTIRGVAHLKIKECDRGQVLIDELAKIGADIRMTNGTLTVQPLTNLSTQTTRLATHGDHRMAMAFSLLTLRGFPIELDNTACVAKSFPTFWREWDKF